MALRDIYEDSVSEWSPTRMQAAQGYLIDLREGLVPEWWSACICQRAPQSGRYTLVDAGTMQRFEKWLLLGYLAVGRVRTQEGPFADARREDNKRVLNDSCPELKADVADYIDSDGTVAMPPDLEMVELLEPPSFQFSQQRPERCVLEIGTTGAHNTFFHLVRATWLARWPYGHDLYLFQYRGPLIRPEQEEAGAPEEMQRRLQYILQNPLSGAPSRVVDDILDGRVSKPLRNL